MGRREQNSKVLKKGFALFDKAIEDYMIETLTNSGELLLAAVARNRTFTGFTGNTQTSYACGILECAPYPNESAEKPIRVSLTPL